MSKELEKKNIFSKMIYHMAECMKSIIPVLVASGLMKIIILFLGYTSLFGVYPDTKVILEAISNAPFYFLPILVAYTSAKHFKTNVICAITVVSALLIPEFVTIMEQSDQVLFAGIPVYQLTYAYTVFPIIILIYLMSLWETFLQKKLKGIWNELFLHLLVVLPTALVGIIIIGPIMGLISAGVLWVISWLQVNIPVLAWAIFGATAPIQVLTGTHWIFIALAIGNLGEFGLDNGFMVGYFMLTMSLSAIAFVAQLRSFDKSKKNKYLSFLITVFFTGTTEPVLFGICLFNKVAMLASIIAGAVAGTFQGIVRIHSYVYAFPTLISLPMFYSESEPSNILKALLAGIISFIVALLVMLLKYKDEDNKEENS